MAKRIVITSGKGGVGKTTVCAHLGYMLASQKFRVLLLDVDLGLNNLDVVMGVENKIVYDIFDVLEGKCRPKQALVQDFLYDNLYVLPSSHTYSSVVVDIKDIKTILQELDSYFDYILIDSPAGIEMGFHRAVSLANDAIVVTTPHISAIRDADKVVGILQSFGIFSINLIVNRARGDLILNGDMISIETISDYLTCEVLGVIPEDDEITCQLLTGGSVAKNTIAYRSIELIAKKLHFGKGDVYDCTKKYRGMFGGLKRGLKRIV